MRYLVAAAQAAAWAVLCLMVVGVSQAQVTSTRVSDADWRCESASGGLISNHQRFDTALIACLNSLDGVYIQGGRYRIGKPAPMPTPTPDPDPVPLPDPPPPPTANLIFDADYRSDTGNWDAQAGNDSTHHSSQRTQRRVAGGGPGGRDAFEIAQRVGQGEFYVGHIKRLANFSAGESRFYRFRLYHDPANTYRTPTGRTIHKLLILGEGGDTGGAGGSRMILNANGYDASRRFALEIVFDGWPSAPPETAELATGVWHDIQVEVRWGTSAYVKVWVNSDEYSRPTIQLAGRYNTPPNNGFTHFGAYSNKGLSTGAVHTFRHSDFEVGTAFDSVWHAKR